MRGPASTAPWASLILGAAALPHGAHTCVAPIPVEHRGGTARSTRWRSPAMMKRGCRRQDGRECRPDVPKGGPWHRRAGRCNVLITHPLPLGKQARYPLMMRALISCAVPPRAHCAATRVVRSFLRNTPRLRGRPAWRRTTCMLEPKGERTRPPACEVGVGEKPHGRAHQRDLQAPAVQRPAQTHAVLGPAQWLASLLARRHASVPR